MSAHAAGQFNWRRYWIFNAQAPKVSPNDKRTSSKGLSLKARISLGLAVLLIAVAFGLKSWRQRLDRASGERKRAAAGVRLSQWLKSSFTPFPSERKGMVKFVEGLPHYGTLKPSQVEQGNEELADFFMAF